MPQLDINTMLDNMVSAAKSSLSDKWLGIADAASTPMKNLAQNIADIEKMKINGTITEEKAQLLIDMQKNAIKTVLLTEEGLGLLAAQAAINAITDVLKGTVNKAIGWSLL